MAAMGGYFLTVLLALVGCDCAYSDSFLSNWMGHFGPVLANQTLLDLTLPGTHDTMTYDLSTTISDGGIDDHDWLASLVHQFGHLGGIGAFIRKQAQTQALTVSQQLDNGIRFLDFRVMQTGRQWRALHMLETNKRAVTYLQEVRTWLDAHPTEVVVIWLSKHGSPCKNGSDQYPSVPPSAKQAFWKEIQGIFSGLLVNTTESSLSDTSISALVLRSHRVIIFASDFAEFTGGNSVHAFDGCLVDNPLSMSSVANLSLNDDLKTFAGFASRRAADRVHGQFLLESMANSPPSSTIEAAAKIEFLPGATSGIKDCAMAFHIPGMTQWCPERLLDVSQLTNYYKQNTLDAAYAAGFEFPNAIYIDAVTPGGLIRTGTQPLSVTNKSQICDIYRWTSCTTHTPSCSEGWSPSGEKAHLSCYDSDGNKHGACALAWQDHFKCCRDRDGEHADSAFAYVDTLLAVNVRRACVNAKPTVRQQCSSLAKMLAARRAQFPRTLWHDVATGRLDDWPKQGAAVYI
jgi:hypothetical protein